MLEGSGMLAANIRALTAGGRSSLPPQAPAPSPLPDLPEQSAAQSFPGSVSPRPAGRHRELK